MQLPHRSFPRLRRLLWRAMSESTAVLNRVLDALPPGRWLHRRVLRGIALVPLELRVGAGHAELDGLRIAFLTDIHAGSFMGEEDIAQVFDLVMAADPDAICFGGDLINTLGSELELFARPLQRLRARHGIHAVPGNHDHYFGRDIGRWKEWLTARGVNVLDNRGMRIQVGSASLWLCGIDELTEGEPDLARALSGRRPGEPCLLLAHHPDSFVDAVAHDVDLVLSGHTHGGQVRIGGWAPVHHSRMGWDAGWFRVGASSLYVSRGVGVTLLPIRIGAPPEVCVVTVRAAASLPA